MVLNFFSVSTPDLKGRKKVCVQSELPGRCGRATYARRKVEKVSQELFLGERERRERESTCICARER